MSDWTVERFPEAVFKGGGTGQLAYQGWELWMFKVTGPTSLDGNSRAKFGDYFGAVLWMGFGHGDADSLGVLPEYHNADPTMDADECQIRLSLTGLEGAVLGEASGNVSAASWIVLVAGLPPGHTLDAGGGGGVFPPGDPWDPNGG